MCLYWQDIFIIWCVLKFQSWLIWEYCIVENNAIWSLIKFGLCVCIYHSKSNLLNLESKCLKQKEFNIRNWLHEWEATWETTTHSRDLQWQEVGTVPQLEGQSKMPKSQSHLVEAEIIMSHGRNKASARNRRHTGRRNTLAFRHSSTSHWCIPLGKPSRKLTGWYRGLGNKHQGAQELLQQ